MTICVIYYFPAWKRNNSYSRVTYCLLVSVGALYLHYFNFTHLFQNTICVQVGLKIMWVSTKRQRRILNKRQHLHSFAINSSKTYRYFEASSKTDVVINLNPINFEFNKLFDKKNFFWNNGAASNILRLIWLRLLDQKV